MNHLLDLIVTICKTASVATAAGIPYQRWQNHVQISYGEDMHGKVNMGRLPQVVIKEGGLSYDQLAENGGMRVTEFTIRIMGPSFTKRINQTIEKLNRIKTSILAGTYNTTVHSLTATASSPQITPYYVFIDLVFTSETTYNNQDYEED